jgi:23S rRNA (pseudouridine1915-N3)-methyltransferase
VKLRLVAVGTKSPDWVAAGFEEYARRMPDSSRLTLVEVPAVNRKGWTVERVIQEEGDRLLGKLSDTDHVVALDVAGRTCSTEELAGKLDDWRMQGVEVSFLVGGADGLDPRCLGRANERLSLSSLTFPHQLVRVILAEQLYRAWTVLHGHPYHRP